MSSLIARYISRQILSSTRRISIASAIIPSSRRLVHDSLQKKAAVAATQTVMSDHQVASSPNPRERTGTFAGLKTVPCQLRDTKGSPAFYKTISLIMQIKERYVQERAIFIKAQEMIPILLGLGASQEDIIKLAVLSDTLENDPTLAFRKSRISRICLDFNKRSMRRLEHQTFKLSEEEDFKRYDSGKARLFDEAQNDMSLNTAFQALLIFKALMINGMNVMQRPNLNYNSNQWVCTVFNLRTYTTKDILGEPALEGVHSDGVDHTMTTFLGSSNMTLDSAATFIHSMDEITGVPISEASPLNICARFRHSTLLDTLLIVDHERKHSLTPVYAEDKTRQATRDMFIFFTRKPVEDTHPSASMDSLKSHSSLPFEAPLVDPSYF